MFLLARITHLTRSNLREGGVILAYGKGIHPIMVKKAWWLSHEVAGHMLFELMMQRDLCGTDCPLHICVTI